MPEEEAFCLLVRLMNQYHLREMFIQDMPGLHLHLYQFERLLEDLEPALYCHLHRKGVAPQLYATQWFLTLFAYRFPLQLVLRIYDLILSEGLEGAILKFGIVLMQKNAETLLGMNDMASLTNFLKDRLFDMYIDQAPSASSLLESGFFGSSGGIDKEIYRADDLVKDACAVKITPELLKTYAAEWEEKQRAEKEREAELETMRSNNASLSLKIRSLEERTEKSDTEHVQMASELVRTKVENQELQDSVESLKGQADELRNMVEKQPEEVEQRLKAEMERIMQRNLEVQNENRGLEEQMSDMEKVLVETKMQYAEVSPALLVLEDALTSDHRSTRNMRRSSRNGAIFVKPWETNFSFSFSPVIPEILVAFCLVIKLTHISGPRRCKNNKGGVRRAGWHTTWSLIHRFSSEHVYPNLLWPCTADIGSVCPFEGRGMAVTDLCSVHSMR